MQELTANVNWIAVAAGTILSFLLGWLWYSPIGFGKKWAQGSRVCLDDAGQMPAMAMVSQFVGIFLFSWVVGVTETRNALATIILITVAFAVLLVANGYFAQKNAYARSVEAGYVIAMAVVMIGCQALF